VTRAALHRDAAGVPAATELLRTTFGKWVATEFAFYAEHMQPAVLPPQSIGLRRPAGTAGMMIGRIQARIALFLALAANPTGQSFLLVILPPLGRQLGFPDIQTGLISSVAAKMPKTTPCKVAGHRRPLSD